MNCKSRKKSKIIFIVCIVIIIALNCFGIFYTKYKTEIRAETIKYGIDYRLVLAIIKVESNFNNNAVSQKGAVGLMQIMPDTAKWICSEQSDFGVYDYNLLTNAEFNIRLGVWYLNYLLNKFDLAMALASYNAGEGVVREWLNSGIDDIADIPYSETKSYVKKVMLMYKLYGFK